MDVNLQTVGKIPVLSSLSGFCRVLRGIGRIFSSTLDDHVANETRDKVDQTVKGIFGKNYSEYTYEKTAFSLGGRMKHGFADIGRGLVEIIPIVGNIAVAIYDKAKDASKEKTERNEQIEIKRHRHTIPLQAQKDAENKKYKQQAEESPYSSRQEHFWNFFGRR